MPRPIKVGRKERMTFAKINEVCEMPNLIQIQTDSYKWFIEEGLREVFDDISPIKDYANNLVLEFIDYSLSDKPKYPKEECKERDVTYAAPLKVRVRLINRETGEVKEQEVFMGDFPLMTERGTFIYNGAERVVVTQLVRSPGPYYEVTVDKSNTKLFSTQIIPNRGAWIEYETDSNEVLSVRVDRTRKQPVTTLLRALGFGSDEEIISIFGEDPRLLKTLEKDTATNYEEGIKEIYKKIRPAEPPTLESARAALNSMFFDPKRYDLAKVGRYKYNKKLGLSNRLPGVEVAEDVINPETGEIMAEAGTVIDRDLAFAIENAGVEYVMAYSKDKEKEGQITKVIGSMFVDVKTFINEYAPQFKNVDIDALKITDKAFCPVLREIIEKAEDEEMFAEMLVDRKNELSPKHIITEDIIASVSYLINLNYGIGNVDDIDHLGNRRLRTVGELLQNQFRIGLTRMERVVKERMTTQDIDVTTPQALMNIRPVTAAIKEFFGSSQLSQFMDQNNPLS
ncbi:MAG: DNA-directed RNA polymerase subunit beta, partial [Firmicutes bacterium]|nr:DNA-directed RNA polymerase subunit beta [Bacillota bacterium]